MSSEIWADVLGQDDAVDRLRAAARSPVHAFLFVGPRGSGKRAAARAFAAAILSTGKEGDEAERDIRLARAERHPDLVVIEPEGALFRGGRDRSKTETEASRFIREVTSSPHEGSRKVVVADAFHTANDEAVGRLLKVIEEPPASSIVVLLAEELLPEQATVASRCLVIEFGTVSAGEIAAALQREGIEPDRAAAVAAAAGGDLDRARLLATDPALEERRRSWWSLPNHLDGTGAAVVRAVTGAQATLDAAEAPLEERQAAEEQELLARVEQYGERGAGRKQLEEQHRRERRKARLDELRFGLATVAARYRDELVTTRDPVSIVASLDALQAAAEALERNPNETLLLQALVLDLVPLVGDEPDLTSEDRTPVGR